MPVYILNQQQRFILIFSPLIFLQLIWATLQTVKLNFHEWTALLNSVIFKNLRPEKHKFWIHKFCGLCVIWLISYNHSCCGIFIFSFSFFFSSIFPILFFYWNWLFGIWWNFLCLRILFVFLISERLYWRRKNINSSKRRVNFVVAFLNSFERVVISRISFEDSNLGKSNFL